MPTLVQYCYGLYTLDCSNTCMNFWILRPWSDRAWHLNISIHVWPLLHDLRQTILCHLFVFMSSQSRELSTNHCYFILSHAMAGRYVQDKELSLTWHVHERSGLLVLMHRRCCFAVSKTTLFRTIKIQHIVLSWVVSKVVSYLLPSPFKKLCLQPFVWQETYHQDVFGLTFIDWWLLRRFTFFHNSAKEVLRSSFHLSHNILGTNVWLKKTSAFKASAALFEILALISSNSSSVDSRVQIKPAVIPQDRSSAFHS